MYNFVEGDFMYKDVIVALATPMMESALSIIRVSGDNCLDLLKNIFSNKCEYEGYRVYYGNIVDGEEVIDQVLISTYRAPKSFTGEDSFEINCHGGMFIVKRIIALCLKQGARLADRGEFSKRAFLNNKMDLVQAESINDMIRASSELESKLAINSLMGNTSKLVENIEKDFLDLLSNIEVNIDYPEYDEAEVVTKEYAIEKINKLKENIGVLIKDSKVGKTIKDGINIAILGKPNVGKSSILNALLEEEKAIVTDIEGTTRDVVEGQILLEGLKINLLDTAGVRNTDNKVEKIGIEKSLELANKADIVIVVLDSSRELSDDDHKLLEITKDKNRIIVANKKEIKVDNFNYDCIKISAKDKDIQDLKNAIINSIGFDLKEYNNKPLLSNARHIGLLENSYMLLENVIKELEFVPVDLLTVELTQALENIRDILGHKAKLNMVDEIFSRFCLGK
jgi:tRNA modification GTPase